MLVDVDVVNGDVLVDELEPDGVAVVVDHGGEIVDCAVVDCEPANVDVENVSLDTVDGDGNHRVTKLIISESNPDSSTSWSSSTLVSLPNPNPNSNPLHFCAAFPNTSDSEEKLEVAWTTDTYENSGSTRVSHITRLAGVWDDVLYTSAATMDIRFVRTRRPMGPRSIRSVSPTPPSTLLPSESPHQVFPTLSPLANQSAFLRRPALPSLSLSISRYAA